MVRLAETYCRRSDFILVFKSLTSDGAWSGQLSETGPPSSLSLEAAKKKKEVNYEKIFQKYRVLSSEN